MIVHELGGCAPTPLAHYLKAVGILRLVTEQIDPGARAWWEGDRYFFASELDSDELERFLTEQYQPTPFVAPWNKGSGFYAGDTVLIAARDSIAPRFEALRVGINAAQILLEGIETADRRVREIKTESNLRSLSAAEKKALRESAEYKQRLTDAEKNFKTLKAELIPNLRMAWRGSHRDWMDAAMVLGDDGTPRFPALLGTGGNDGRLDFTNNYFQRLAEVFDMSSPQGAARVEAREWFSGSLWGGARRSLLSDRSVGQFLPGTAGGANAGNGPDADSLLNPVDFLLMLEGAVAFTAGLSNRAEAQQPGRAAAPFAVSAQAAGYFSSGDSDESARGEQWMPLWDQPLSFAELSQLLAAGRAQIGRRNSREPLDLARSIARIGTSRGIASFQRFGYIERNGQSNLAVPLGRFAVRHGNSHLIGCLGDLDGWTTRLHRQARDKNASAELKRVEQQLASAIFAVAQHVDEPQRWQSVLLSLADVERVLATGAGAAAGPIPQLRPEWFTAAHGADSPEIRLALAFALQAYAFRPDSRPIDGVRKHAVTLSGIRFATSGAGAEKRLRHDASAVLRGRSGEADAQAVLIRRLIEATQLGRRRFPLKAASNAAAQLQDIQSLILGEADFDRTMKLAQALMALDREAWASSNIRIARNTHDRSFPDDGWLAIRTALSPWALPSGKIIGADPAILRKLMTGDATAAFEIARRRLLGAGISTALRRTAVPAAAARRWAAALAFPLSQKDSKFALRLVQIDFNQGDKSNGR